MRKVVTIGDLGEVITGKTPPTADKGNYGGTIPFITPRDMVGNRYVFSTERYITEKGKSTVKNCVLPKDAICVSCIGSDMGKSVLTRELSITNQQINSIIASNEYDPLYVYYLLRTKEDLIKSLGKNATAVPILNKSKFSAIEIEVPPLATQHRIATILSRYDSLIENYQKQIKLLEEAAQRLYKEWFIDLHFPGHENTNIIDGVPEGWERKKVGEIANISAGGDKPDVVTEKQTSECQVPIYSNGTTKEGLYGYTNKSSNTAGSITISARGSIGFACLRMHDYFSIVRLISIKPYKNEDLMYLYQFAKVHTFMSNGAAQQQLTVPMVKAIEVVYPAETLIKAFDCAVLSFYKQIQSLQSQLRLLTEARDRLLPKLMSGEIEV